MRSIRAWAVITPRGRLIIESIMPTRLECIQSFVMELACMFYSDPIKLWDLTFKRKGFTCVKITIKVKR